MEEDARIDEASDSENEEMDSNQSSDSDSENNEETEEDRNNIRSELKSMSFAELLELKQKLGSKMYNEALFGDGGEAATKKKSKRKPDIDFKRENKNRPREVSSKKQVPLLGGVKKSRADDRPRDPRFDSNCGEFDRDKFNEDYGFVSEIREKEAAELKKQLKTLKGDQVEEKKKIKTVLQRMQNQNVEAKKLKERKLLKTSFKQKNKEAIKGDKKPFFVSKGEQKAQELVKQYEELKSSGKLNKHLEKRRKKNVARDRKKYNFD